MANEEVKEATTLTLQQALALLRKWKTSPEDVIQVDWSNLRRAERFAGAVLANALLTDFSHRRFEIIAPLERYRWGVLARASLLFAIAQRNSECTRILNAGETDLRLLEPWKRTWTPGLGMPYYKHLQGPAAEANQGRFPSLDGEGEHPSVYGPYHAAFVNFHWNYDPGVRSSRDRIHHWLTHILPGARRAGKTLSQPANEFLRDTDRVLTELLENVNHHGLFREETGNRIPSRSLVQLSVTLGGGSESFNRMYLAIQDTGPGIIATARPKLRSAPKSDANLLRALFDGALQKEIGRRGFGLPEVASIISTRDDATLRVATGGLELTLQGERIEIGEKEHVPGTAVVAMMPLPILAESEDEDDPALTTPT